MVGQVEVRQHTMPLIIVQPGSYCQLFCCCYCVIVTAAADPVCVFFVADGITVVVATAFTVLVGRSFIVMFVSVISLRCHRRLCCCCLHGVTVPATIAKFT